MSLNLAKTEIKLQKGLCVHATIDATEQTLQELVAQYVQKDALVVIWQQHRIVWGRLHAGQIELADGSDLQETFTIEVRVFNDVEELHLYYKGGKYEGRYVRDYTDGTKGEVCQFVDSYARLWGERSGSVQNGFVMLRDEERFLQMQVPATVETRFYGLTTRNYINANEQTGQAGYSDYRFMSIDAEGAVM